MKGEETKMPHYIIKLRDMDALNKCCMQLKAKKYFYKQLTFLQSIYLSTPNSIKIEELFDPTWLLRLDEDVEVQIIQDQESATTEHVGVPWGIKKIGAVYSRIPSRYPRPKVAVIDTGLRRHPAIRVSSQYVNFTTEGSALDYNGHGTHIAGTIAGYSPRANRRNEFHGVYPQLPIMAVKAFNRDGSARISAILESIEWCIKNEVRIMNMSFGLDQHHPALYEAIQTASQKGILMVAASGNEGGNGLKYPARYPEVISVGSINKENEISSFSQYGSNLDIVAPGEEIVSTWKNKKFKTLSGTSMACGHITGAIAIILSIKPELTAREARQILLSNTVRLNTPSIMQGYGLVSLKNMINSLK